MSQVKPVGQAAHEAWKVWLVGEGYADEHRFKFESRRTSTKFPNSVRFYEFCTCGLTREKHHPDMVPFEDLPKNKAQKYIVMEMAGYELGLEAGHEPSI